MINSIKQAIVNKLLEIYPEATIYDEDIPQNFKKHSFLLSLINQDYDKRISNKYKTKISFDVAYFSEKDKTEIKNDCLEVQLNLFRNFDLIDTFRVINKQTNITDNVLHFTFEVNYSEIIEDLENKIQKQEINTNLKEE